MPLIPAVRASLAGLDVSSAAMVAAGAGGDSFDNPSGDFYLLAENTGGGALTITFVGGNADNFGIISTAHDNVPTAIAATTGRRLYGPFPANRFNDANGRVQMTYSGVTGLKVLPIAMP